VSEKKNDGKNFTAIDPFATMENSVSKSLLPKDGAEGLVPKQVLPEPPPPPAPESVTEADTQPSALIPGSTPKISIALAAVNSTANSTANPMPNLAVTLPSISLQSSAAQTPPPLPLTQPPTRSLDAQINAQLNRPSAPGAPSISVVKEIKIAVQEVSKEPPKPQAKEAGKDPNKPPVLEMGTGLTAGLSVESSAGFREKIPSPVPSPAPAARAGGETTSSIRVKPTSGNKGKGLSHLLTGLAFLSVPLVAGLVFWFLSSQTEPAHQKAKAVAGTALSAEASAPTAPVAPLATQAAQTPPPIAPPSLASSIDAIDLFMNPSNSPRLATIHLTSQPPGNDYFASVPRGGPGLVFQRDDIFSLRRKITSLPVAGKIAGIWKASADAALLTPPMAYESLHASGPAEYIGLSKARAELEVANRLLMTWIVWGDPKYAFREKAEILKWASTYKSTGDAFADSQLEPIIVAYANTFPSFTTAEQSLVDSWLYSIADRGVTEAVSRARNDDIWAAYHLKTITLIAYSTGNANLQKYVKTNFNEHVASLVKENSKTTTLIRYDSLGLQSQHLAALLRASMILLRSGRADAETTPRPSTTLARAMDNTIAQIWAVPPRTEFGNLKDDVAVEKQDTNQVGWSKQPFQLESTHSFFETAVFFRPSLLQSIAKIYSSAEGGYTSASLINDSLIRDTRDFETPASRPPTGPGPDLRQPAQAAPNKK
jgi:hypothetical protein